MLSSVALAIDAHIHVMPWWDVKPSMFEALTRGRDDLDELQVLMKSPARLLRLMDQEGIERAVLVNYPSPHMLGLTHSVNDYVAQYCAAAPDRLIAMGGVHPRLTEDPAAEVRRAREMGVRALKVHPPHMGFAANAYQDGLDGLRAVYEEAQRLRMPVLIHTGTSIFPGARSRLGEPMAVDDVAVDFPDLTLVLAHAGRPLWMEQAFFLARRFPNVHLELSGIPPKALLRYLPRLAEVAHKAIYGSDWPSPGVRSMGRNLAEFQAVELPPEKLAAILTQNALRVYGSAS